MMNQAEWNEEKTTGKKKEMMKKKIMKKKANKIVKKSVAKKMENNVKCQYVIFIFREINLDNTNCFILFLMNK